MNVLIYAFRKGVPQHAVCRAWLNSVVSSNAPFGLSPMVLCVGAETRGSRITDAWLAALAIESGCEWITLDRDFARFPGLKWQAPSLPDP
jgi:predicted nucleic acid-binding protein